MGCSITENNEITEPGIFRVWITVENPQNYPIVDDDNLWVSIRDFRVFKGENYADVFQDPEQFLPSEKSIVSLNLFSKDLPGTYVQVAHGSIAPLNFDKFLFLISPLTELVLNGKEYPLRSKGENTNTLVELERSIVINENRVTDVFIKIDIEKTAFRLLDEFVFDVNLSEVNFENH